MSVILCLDVGTAHTGIAISREGILVEPLTTIFESKIDKLIGKLIPIIVKNHPDTIVIGVPDHGPMLSYSNEVKKALEKVFFGEVVLFPEDLTSRMAKNLLKKSGKTLTKRKQSEHQTASAIILEEYLDSISS